MASLRSTLGLHELTDKKSGLHRALLAEFLGTGLLNFFGCGAVVTGSVVTIALSFGLAVATIIQGIGHVSGGHINPAVTCGLLTAGKVPVVRAVLYIAMQSAGAIAGSGILKLLSPESMSSKLGTVSLGDGVTPAQGMGVEFFLAIILVLTVFGACDSGKPDSKGVAPLIIGMSIVVGHIVGIPRTGAGMNPARSLGSAVILSAYDDHWLYWVGPILGGVVAGLTYKLVIGEAKVAQNTGRQYGVTEEKELQQLTHKSRHAAA